MYKHGISVIEKPTSLMLPQEVSAAIIVAIGTAPVNLASNPQVNKPVAVFNFGEAVENFGYSDDWLNYSLCEVMDAAFRRFAIAPIIFINVLDPKTHRKSGTENFTTVAEFGILNALGILKDSLVLKKGATTISKEDYFASFDDAGKLQIEMFKEEYKNVELVASFDALDPSMITSADIIGGYSAVKDTNMGLELIEEVFPRLGLIPGIIIAPGYSHIPEVASVIDAKSTGINGVFKAVNYLDLESDTVKKYQDVPKWKNDNGYTSKNSYLLWPKAKIGEKVYHLSTIFAALTARTDAENGDVPHVSPSNKLIPITGLIAGDKEIYLDQMQANFLNGNGINTCINIKGWRSWGNNTAAFPGTTDPKDRFLAIRRVLNWWANSFILTYFDKVDDPTNLRLVENIVDSENIRANGFQARGVIAGAKIEFKSQLNPITDIMNGTIRFTQKIGAFPPAREIVNELEFDPYILRDSILGGN